MAFDPDQAFEALVWQESKGQPGAIGPQTKYGQALGMAQMLPETAREMAAKVGLPFRPDLLRGKTPQAAAYQKRLGRAYFDEGLEKTGNLRDAFHYYHGGPDRSLWGPKTKAYAASVMRRMGGR